MHLHCISIRLLEYCIKSISPLRGSVGEIMDKFIIRTLLECCRRLFKTAVKISSSDPIFQGSIQTTKPYCTPIIVSV